MDARHDARCAKTLIFSKHRGSARRNSLVLAGVVFVLFAGLVAGLWFRARNLAPESLPRAAAQVPLAPISPDQPRQGLGKGEKFFAQFVDRDDPTRLAGEITAAASEPLPDRKNLLTRPEAWFFLKDGKSVLVRADEGEVTMPDGGSRPAWGLMRGAVRVEVFALRPDRTRPDPAIDKPLGTLTTPRLTLDWNTGQLDVPEDFQVRGSGLEYDGEQMLAEFDPAARRLDRVHVRRTMLCRFTQPEPPPTTQPATPVKADASIVHGTPASAATTPNVAPFEQPLPALLEDLFAVQVTRSVVLTHREQTLRSPSLDGWVRLVGGRVPRPLGGVDPPEKAAVNAPASATAMDGRPTINAASASAKQPTDPASAVAPAAAAAPIELAFEGPLSLRRLEAPPEELTEDDLFVRCSSGEETGGRVLCDDTSLDAQATGERLELAGTRGEVWLSGDGAARMVSTKLGAITAPRLELSRGQSTLRALGPGELAGITDDDANASIRPTATWREQAEFRFALVGETRALERAMLVGGAILAPADGTSAHADSITAAFDPARRGTAITSVQLAGRARASTAEGGSFESDVATIDFATGSIDASPSPTQLKAEGNVRAAQAGDTLACGTLTVAFAPDEHGKNLPISVIAETQVRVKTRDGVDAACATLTAKPVEKQSVLLGDATAPARLTSGASVLSCGRIELDGTARALTAVGAGTLTHAKTTDADQEKMDLSWSTGAHFDDPSGLASCEGEARATIVRGDGSMLVAQGDAINALLDAAPTQPEPQLAELLPDQRAVLARGVRRVEIVGDLAGDQYRVEAQLTEATSERGVRRLVLRSSRVEYDHAQRLLTVPAAGQALVTSEPSADAGKIDLTRANANESLADRSRTLLKWKQSLTMPGLASDGNQAIMRARVLGDVQLAHRDTPVAQAMLLEAGTLDAEFGPAGEQGGGTQLVRATARGAVWTRAGDREMTSDTMVYDALLGEIDAGGEGTQGVVVAQPGSSPTTAQRVRHNLRTGRMTVEKPSGTAPR